MAGRTSSSPSGSRPHSDSAVGGGGLCMLGSSGAGSGGGGSGALDDGGSVVGGFCGDAVETEDGSEGLCCRVSALMAHASL